MAASWEANDHERNRGSRHSRGGGPSPLARTRRDRDGAVHGRARHFDRERGIAVDQDGSEFLAGEPAVGDHRILDLLRWVSPAWWEARGSARAPAPVYRGVAARVSPLRSLTPTRA